MSAADNPSPAEQCAASRASIYCPNAVFPEDHVTCCQTRRACTEVIAALNATDIVTCGGSKYCFTQWSVASGYCVQALDGYVAETYPKISVASVASGGAATVTIAGITTTATAAAATETTTGVPTETTANIPTSTSADGAAGSVDTGTAGTSSSGNTSANAVKIVVPIVLVLVLVALSIAGFLFFQRRRKRSWHAPPEPEKAGVAPDINEPIEQHYIPELHAQFTGISCCKCLPPRLLTWT
jgi:hypothetical protein